MKTILTSTLAMAASLALFGTALAQTSDGPETKGNAPLKHSHTVNDGSAKRGSNSFTQKQAMEHIKKSGFSSVTNLVKGEDGVWRGQAVRHGATVDVAMDFKGNVSTPDSRAAASDRESTTTRKTSQKTVVAPEDHKGRRHHVSCTRPSADGAACSGVDHNGTGVSD